MPPEPDAQAGGTPNFVIDWALANVKDISPNFRQQVNQLIEHTIATEKELAASQERERGLAMLVKRLCHRLPKDDSVRLLAVDFLNRKDLLGSILRKDAHEG